jgi:hypothetical protein
MSGFIYFFKQFRLIFISIALLLLVYFLLRILFLVYNRDMFSGIPAKQIGLDFIWGGKLDLSAIVWLNLPVFFLYIFASYYPKKKKIILRFLLILFLLINISALALNVFDIAYFKFAKHRSNTDLLYVWKDSYCNRLLAFYPLLYIIGLRIVLFCQESVFIPACSLQTGDPRFVSMYPPCPSVFSCKRVGGQPIDACITIIAGGCKATTHRSE